MTTCRISHLVKGVAVATLLHRARRKPLRGDYRPDDDTLKRTVFERSYVEVLRFLQDQDTKLNYLLVALAFLATAGFTVQQVGTTNHTTMLQWGNHSAPAYYVLFMTFAGAVACAAFLVLAAIGPTSRIATPWVPPRRRESLLYYQAIANDRKWMSKLRRDGIGLQTAQMVNFHEEAADLARQAVFKVRVGALAGAFAGLALLSLLLEVAYSKAPDGVSARQASAGATGAMLVLPMLVRAFGYLYRYSERREPAIAFLARNGLSLSVAVLAVTAIITGSSRLSGPAIAYALGAMFGNDIATIDRRAWPLLLVVVGCGLATLVSAV